jgi:hypothetical protein
MFNNATLEYTALLLSIASCLRYCYKTACGPTRPSRASYWIWSLVGILMLLSFEKSGGSTLLLQVTFAVNPIIISLVLIKYGTPGFSFVDKVCLGLTALSAGLWGVLILLFGNTETVALPIFLLIMLTDLFGGVQTFRKAWSDPRSEDAIAWLLVFVACLFSAAAATRWNFTDIVMNGYMILSLGWITGCAWIRPVYVPPPSHV